MPDAPDSSQNRPRWMPDLLATRAGRYTAFFFLYLTEGIPWGFTAFAVVQEMKLQQMSATDVGFFSALLSLPWAMKWMVAPVVDVFSSDRLGRRRVWIVSMQMLMLIALFISAGMDFSENFFNYALIILLVNAFSATQDVAIDALACGALQEDERGTANGLMFSGHYLGTAIGGAGVIFLTAHMPFETAGYIVLIPIVLVTLFIALPLREPKTSNGSNTPGGDDARSVSVVATQIRTYGGEALHAIAGSRGALAAAVIAVLPFGSMSLSQTVDISLKADLGLGREQISSLTLATTIVSAAACVIGGLLSDRLGRRRMLAGYIVCLAIPPLLMAAVLHHYGMIMPVKGTPAAAPSQLIVAFWAICLLFAAFHGLMFGTRAALFMDVCDPKVAATQFTAYMALLNVTIGYSAAWQGWAIDKFGYPITLTIDAAFGLVCLAVLPFVTPRKTHAEPEQLPAEPQPL